MRGLAFVVEGGEQLDHGQVVQVLPHAVRGEDEEEVLEPRVGAQLVVAHGGRAYLVRVRARARVTVRVRVRMPSSW